MALVLGNVESPEELGEYGASLVVHSTHEQNELDGRGITSIISKAAEMKSCHTVVVNHSSLGKSIIGRLANRLQAGSVSSANSVPSSDGDHIKVKRPVFAGKAIAEFKINTPNRVISLMSNAFPPEKIGSACDVETINFDAPASAVKVVETKKS